MLERFLGPVLVPQRYSRYLMLGCCLGVAAILVVLSLFANYFRAVETQLLGIHPHLSMRPAGAERTLSKDELMRIARVAEGLTGVMVARPAIDRIAHLQVAAVESHPVVCRDGAQGSTCFDPATPLGTDTVRGVTGFNIDRSKTVRVRLRGLDLGVEASSGDPEGPMTLELERVLDVRGKGLDLRRLAQGLAQGMPMAGYFERRLSYGATPLDDFLLGVLAGGDGESRRALGAGLHHFRLLSTLHLGLRQDAHPLVVTSLENAVQILGDGPTAPAGANTFEIRLEEPRLAPSMAEVLSRRLSEVGLTIVRPGVQPGEAGSGDGRLVLRSWLEQDEGALRLLGVLRWVIFVVASSVMVVAALGVMSTLSLVVLEGRQKIAMMRAMGLRDRNLYVALAIESIRIATVGLVSGLTLGAVTSWALLRIPGFAQGLGKMGVVDPRVMFQGGDLVAVSLATWGLFLVVAWWPAREACRIDPVSGLRG